MEHSKYGDIFDMIMQNKGMPEVLARTLFHQIVEGIDYLHNNGVAHMDLKLENILLGEDLNIKIIDFDMAKPLNEGSLLNGSGTLMYRAPEIKKGFCSNQIAADVYSLGVILFIMLSGTFPYAEIEKEFGIYEYNKLYSLLRTNNTLFWQTWGRLKGNKDFYSQTFIDFFNWLVKEDPSERPTIQDIRNHAWFLGEVLEGKEFEDQFKTYLKI
jgi:serine/threonine protein kinase